MQWSAKCNIGALAVYPPRARLKPRGMSRILFSICGSSFCFTTRRAVVDRRRYISLISSSSSSTLSCENPPHADIARKIVRNAGDSFQLRRPRVTPRRTRSESQRESSRPRVERERYFTRKYVSSCILNQTYLLAGTFRALNYRARRKL